MNKKILITIMLTLMVSFIFLFSINFSSAFITIIAPTNVSNHSSSLTVNITYINGTDLTDPTNATIYYNVAGTDTFLGAVTCNIAGLECTGSLTLTSAIDGNYVLNATIANLSTVNVTQNWSLGIANMTGNVTFDSTPPNVTDFNISLSKDALTTITGKNGLNFTSQIIILNVSVNDSLMLSSANTNVFVFFNFTNSAGTTNISLNGSKGLGSYWNASVNTSFIVDGHYNVTVWANDSLGNWNSSEQRLDFTVDTTIPAITLTLDDTLTTKSTIVFGVAVSDTSGIPGSCAVDRTDSTISGGGTLAQTVTENSLNCGISYAYKVACTDALGLSYETAATSFSTDSCSSSGGSSGSGGSSTTTPVINAGSTVNVKINQIQSSGGYRAKFQKDSAINFEITPSSGSSIETHKLLVTRIGDNSVTVIIESDPVTLSINIGEQKKIDLDGDAVFDVEVRLNSISSGRADLSIERIEEASDEGIVSEGEEIAPEDQIKESDAKGGEEGEEGGRNLTMVWIILVVVIVAVIAAIIYQKKRQ